MQFMQDLTFGGWELLVSSFGFTTPRRYNSSVSSVPNGHLVGNFSDFYYNWWWQGIANIDLSNADQAVNIKLSGEAYAFTENLDAVSIALSRAVSFQQNTTSNFLFLFFNLLPHFPLVVKKLYEHNSRTTVYLINLFL